MESKNKPVWKNGSNEHWGAKRTLTPRIEAMGKRRENWVEGKKKRDGVVEEGKENSGSAYHGDKKNM